MEIAANVLAVLLGLIYLFHGVMILRRHEMQIQNAETIGWPWERYRLVAIPEIAAAIGSLRLLLASVACRCSSFRPGAADDRRCDAQSPSER